MSEPVILLSVMIKPGRRCSVVMCPRPATWQLEDVGAYDGFILTREPASRDACGKHLGMVADTLAAL